ncbi:MAG: hypothetical protein DHS20C15_15110 [Planctomycetota bacterium]|nr:MAG: hypothetical protein DHS20C15_15110 [Planctomycetota bacterium]
MKIQPQIGSVRLRRLSRVWRVLRVRRKLRARAKAHAQAQRKQRGQERAQAGWAAKVAHAVVDTFLFVPRRLIDVLMFFPRLLVGAKRYTLPRGFGSRRVLQEEDFDSEVMIHGHNPVQRLLEHLRVGYLSILEALDGEGSVAVMSPKGREGRSMIAANLAVAMARDTGRDVVLLDLDLRRPTQHTLLNVDDGPGFSDLHPGDDLTDVLVDTGRANLKLIRAGLDLSDPVRCLNRGVLPELLAQLERDGHFVIIDCAEANAFTESQLIAEHVSGIVTVVKLGATKRGSLAAYYRKLDGARFLGVIANYHELWIPSWLYRFL